MSQGFTTGNLITGSTSNGPEGAKYDPDRPPVGAWGSEEFLNNTETLTWRWGNQGLATQTLQKNRSYLYSPTASNNTKVRWTTPPSGNFTAVMKMSNYAGGVFSHSGLILLETGSEATPTVMSQFIQQAKNSIPWGSFGIFTRTSYTSAYSGSSGDASALDGFYGLPVYMALDYVSSTKKLRYFYSAGGDAFRTATGWHRTLGADPVSVGYYAEGPETTIAVKFFRIFNSSIETVIATNLISILTIGS